MAHPFDEKSLADVISQREQAEEIYKVLFSISDAVNTTLDLNDLYRTIQGQADGGVGLCRSLHRSLDGLFNLFLPPPFFASLF
jgi:hypothetical protein